MAKTFTPTARVRKTIEFGVALTDGTEEVYHFDAPKVAGAMMPILDPGSADDEIAGLSMTQATWAWLKQGLPEEEYARLTARLSDPDDDLDVPDVIQMVRWLLSQVSGRPTGSRRG